MDLDGLATLAVLFVVTFGVTVTVLMCARPRPCRNCRRRGGTHSPADTR